MSLKKALDLQKSILFRMTGKGMVLDVYENGNQASCLLVSVSSLRVVSTLHITFSWLPFPIGQLRSQVWCRPYLALLTSTSLIYEHFHGH